MDFDSNWTAKPKREGTGIEAGTGNEPGAENVDGSEPAPYDPLAGISVGAKSASTPKSNRAPLGDTPSDTGGANTEAGEGSSSDASANGTDANKQLVKRNSIAQALRFPKRGAHLILTDALIQEYCDNLRTCIFQEVAAIEAGISIRSLKDWLRQGRIVHEYLWDAMQQIANMDWDSDRAEAEFEKKVAELTEADWQVYKLYSENKKAKAEGEREDLEFIARARAKDWKAAKYRLEIRDPERYRVDGGSSTKVKISQTDGSGQTTFEVVNYNDWVNDENEDAIEVEAEIIREESE